MKPNTSNNELPKFLYGCPHCLEMYEQGYAKAQEEELEFLEYINAGNGYTKEYYRDAIKNRISKLKQIAKLSHSQQNVPQSSERTAVSRRKSGGEDSSESADTHIPKLAKEKT